MATPNINPISTASFRSDVFTYDPLVAGETISQSANIAGSLGVLKRGTVLYGPAVGLPITTSTLLTTATGAGAARCILAADIDTTGGQVTGLVYTQGKFLDTAMIFTAAGAASDVAQLRQFGVYVLTVEQRSGKLVPMMSLPATGGPLPAVATPKDAAEILKNEVEAIKSANAAQPGVLEPQPGISEPAWAIAAFGEPAPTSEKETRAKLAEEGADLAAKQKEELEELEAEHNKALGDLHKKQAEARSRFIEKSREAVAKAQPAPRVEHETHPAPHVTHTAPPPEKPPNRK